MTTLVSDLPLVSIGMPVYNGAQTLRKALDGLLAQDYGNVEMIISDNASTDVTGDICAEYAAKSPHIRYVRNEVNKGSVWNFNHVFELSSGKYFMWAAHDDWHDSTFISKCVKKLEDNPTAVLCYPLIQFVDPQGQFLQVVDCELNTYRLNRFERLHTVILRMQADTAMYGLIRADTLRRTSLAQDTHYSDKNLLYQLAIYGDIVKVPEVLHYYQFVEKPLTQYVAQMGIGKSSSMHETPEKALKKTISRTIFKLDVPFWEKPLLAWDAVYCLNRRYSHRSKKKI